LDRSLLSLTHSAAIGIIRRAGWNRKHAGTGGGDLVLGGGGGDLGGSGCSGKDENNDESANDMLHVWAPFEVLFVKLLITNGLESDDETDY